MGKENEENLKNKTIDFSVSFEEFKEKQDKKGCFEGLLVNYNHKNLAHGYYKFTKGSMKANEGKTMLLLYNHRGNNIPVGTCKGVETDEGFKIEAQLQLTTDENGNVINKEAYALYDLMKNQGAKFELSAGGEIEDGESKEITQNGKTRWFYEIKKFTAYEGSITPKGAVHGSKITKVFNDNEGEDKMTLQEQQQFIAALIGAMQKEIFSAERDEEIKALPGKISKLEQQFSAIKETLTEEVKDAFNEQFNEINNVIKGLKADFKPTEKQVSFADEFMAAYNTIVENGGKLMQVTPETVLKFAAATPGTTTGEGTKAAVKAHQLLGIFKRLQEVNPVVADLNIISISDNSLELDREEIGLPEVAWVGEEDTRAETEGVKLKDVNIAMHQIYALPKISNKLMASNYVGYVAFLMDRVEYAWGLKIANTMFNGTGAKQPLGILRNTDVASTEWDLAALDDEGKIAALVTLFGNTRDEISSKAKWYMRRETWTALTLLKDKDGRLQLIDLKNGGERKLLSRPVVIIDSANSGLKTIAEAKAGEPFMVLGDFKGGMLGVTNPKMNLSIKDQITGKGWTAYYMEKGLGFGVVLPENFKIVKNKTA